MRDLQKALYSRDLEASIVQGTAIFLKYISMKIQKRPLNSDGCGDVTSQPSDYSSHSARLKKEKEQKKRPIKKNSQDLILLPFIDLGAIYLCKLQ